MQGNSWKKEEFTMYKSIIILGFFFALLSTAFLHATVPKGSSLKTYSAVAAQFAYHVPDADYFCTTNYLF